MLHCQLWHVGVFSYEDSYNSQPDWDHALLLLNRYRVECQPSCTAVSALFFFSQSVGYVAAWTVTFMPLARSLDAAMYSTDTGTVVLLRWFQSTAIHTKNEFVCGTVLDVKASFVETVPVHQHLHKEWICVWRCWMLKHLLLRWFQFTAIRTKNDFLCVTVLDVKASFVEMVPVHRYSHKEWLLVCDGAGC